MGSGKNGMKESKQSTNGMISPRSQRRKELRNLQKASDFAACIPWIVPTFGRWKGGVIATDSQYQRLKAWAEREGRPYWAKGTYRDCWFIFVGEPRKCRQPLCGARTRAGTPCKAKTVPGKGKCRLHGGCSTGPTTAEGRAKIAESNRRRAQLRKEQNEVQKNGGTTG